MRQKLPLEPTGNGSFFVSPLDVGHAPKDVIRGKDPRISMFCIISLGLDAARIAGNNTMNDFGFAARWDKYDYISSPHGLTLIRNDVETISVHKERIHTGANVVDVFLFH